MHCLAIQRTMYDAEFFSIFLDQLCIVTVNSRDGRKVAVSAISHEDPSQDQPNDHDRVSSQSASSRQGQESLAIERRFPNDAEHTRQCDHSALAGSVGNDTRSQAIDDAGSDLVDARHLTFAQPHLGPYLQLCLTYLNTFVSTRAVECWRIP